jgi:DNA-binding NarL/FixJ family response regulator
MKHFKAKGELRRKIGVVVVDDHARFRQGLVSLLNSSPRIKVLGEAADGWQAVELVRRLQPDVVIMDMRMPNLDGIEATRLITSEFNKVRVIGLSMCEAKDKIADMYSAGADAFLSKCDPSETLITAILNSVNATRGPVVKRDKHGIGDGSKKIHFRLPPRHRAGGTTGVY